MQKYSTLFVIILICVNIASSLRLNPIDASLLPSNSIRAQLTQMLIQVQQEESPRTIQTFLTSIQAIVAKLRDEQARHQVISDKMLGQCKAENKFRRHEVKIATASLASANSARAKCQTSFLAATKDLPILTSARDEYVAELARAQKQRDEEKASYRQRKADYSSAIVFLKDFMAYITSTKSSSFTAQAFAEKSETLLRHATKLGMLSDVIPVLITLAQTPTDDVVPSALTVYTTHSDVELEAKLRTTLTALAARLQADLTSNRTREQKARRAFGVLKTSLTKAINTLNNNIARTNKQIDDMTRCIAAEDVVIATAGSKLSRNGALLQSAINMCASFSAEFIDATENRIEEVKTVLEIIKVIESRFGNISASLKQYLVNVAAGWIAYTNSTAFQRYIRYNQKHTVDNLEGKKLSAQTA